MSKKYFETVELDEENHALVICDQTKLPGCVEFLSLTKPKDIWNAIYLLQVRGAPAIGVSAAIGLYVIMRQSQAKTFAQFYQEFVKNKEYLNSARPTAVNLSWALTRMEKVCSTSKEKSIEEIKEILHQEAIKIREEDIAVCKAIGENGLTLIKDGDGLLTHCNAGRLAAVKYGMATAPMYRGAEKGYTFQIFSDETRPLLQGARLTCYELNEAGLNVTVQCDSACASAMRKGWIQACFVGCDRVAANGDTANKIGTSLVALAAQRYHIPFYVCAPTSTIDMATPTGDTIHIEERKGEEVTEMWYKKRMAPEGIHVYNPAFDITDQDLITAFVTEKGVIYPPFKENFKKLFTQ